MKRNLIFFPLLVAIALLIFSCGHTPGTKNDFPVKIVIKNDTFAVTKMTLDKYGNYMYFVYPISDSNSIKVQTQVTNQIGKAQITIVTLK